MKTDYSNPRKLAFINALVIFFATIATGVIYTTLLKQWPVAFKLITSGLVLATFAYFLFHFTLDRFIYSKVRLIYKTIRTLKISGKEKSRHPYRADTLEHVSREVEKWSKFKSQEIDELRQMAEYRREFLGNISHELKAPIFNIQGYILTLLDGGLSDPSINMDYLFRTETSVNRLIAIVEDLETISRLEAGELKLNMVKFDVVALAREVMDFMEINAKKRNNNLFFNQNYEKPIPVIADKDQIRQLFINLIDNAMKYGDARNGSTKISFFDMDDHILIEVTDNGSGMEAAELTRIFERFYRTDKGRSREHGGTGLGLAIVKHIIGAHEQTINVRSKPGVGTTFAFTLKKA
ncbi:ATP-binding protein [Lentimicrobium sp.]